jgi:high affinity Mn2+ porin
MTVLPPALARRTFPRGLVRRLAAALAGACLALPALADGGTASSDFEARVQSTWIRQIKGAFRSPYEGARSLSGDREASYSFTAGLALGWRLAPGLELHLNPEAAQGVPLSGLNGLGGFTNAELSRAGSPDIQGYLARAFVRRTWGLGGGREEVAGEPGQLAGSQDRRRLVLTAGKVSLMDLFDDNTWAHDPRTQFTNLAFGTHGAYDFAADVRGYTWGAAIEFVDGERAIRAGRFAQPREPNQMALDPRLGRHYGDQIELEQGWRLGERAGRMRLLVFRNQAVMGSWRDAIALAAPGVPDIAAVRAGRRAKRGAGVNLEHEIAPGVGVFARFMRADGQTEPYAFAEIDRSRSAGLVAQGGAWGRPQDAFGMAIARHDLSAAHRDYLAAGGLGYFVGDGRLAPAGERIVELFYRIAIAEGLWLSVGRQHITNPGYNADRGPVSVTMLRLHLAR